VVVAAAERKQAVLFSEAAQHLDGHDI
jgi:hypothetical protein